jgi:uncharacterized membrane protein
MRNRVWLILSVVCLAILCLAGSLGATVYHYQDLTLQGLNLTPTGSNPDQINAINDSRWIVGSYFDSGISNYLPFVWRPGLGRTTLPLGTGIYWGKAHGLNNAGQIVGEIFVSMALFMPHYPCLWPGPLQDPTELYVFPPSIEGYMVDVETPAYAINDSGQIAGDLVFDVTNPDPSLWNPHAARWTLPQVTPIDLDTLGGNTSSGRSINNANQVAGTAKINVTRNHACLWVPGNPPKDLMPTFAYSSAKAINNQGNVAGQADLTPGLGSGHAFFWDHNTGTYQDMCPLDYESSPCGLSDANEAAGYVMSTSYVTSVFFWTPKEGKKDLNTLVANLPAGVTLQTAAAISRKGNVTGFDSQGHAYLLTPIVASPGNDLLLLN